MQFKNRVTCSCGASLEFETSGSERWSGLACPRCGAASHLLDPLSVSPVAERILARSFSELEAEDYTLSILFSAIAIETFIQAFYLKIKAMEEFEQSYPPTSEQEERWGKEYKNLKAFLPRLNKVATLASGMTFNEFVRTDAYVQEHLKSINSLSEIPDQYLQHEIFDRRNKIAHLGFVDFGEKEAQKATEAALLAVVALRRLDQMKFGNI